MARRAAGWLAAALTAPACAVAVDAPGPDAEPAGEAASSIRGGYADSGDLGVVGVVVTTPAGGVKAMCSGALIAPTLVLTAQHCVAAAPRIVRCDRARFGEPADPAHLLVTLHERMWSEDTVWLPVLRVMRPPGSGELCGRDVALIELDAPVSAADAAPIAPRLSRPPEEGEPYAAVGYGLTGVGAPDAGVRRRRDGLAVRCLGFACGDGDHVAGTEWRGTAGTCSGDSGGPALDAWGRSIGVISRGAVACAGPIYGGLMGHRAWLAREALRAAEAGGYAAPAWADLAASDPDDGWRSCAHAPPAPGRGGGPGAAALAALLAVVRRRSTISAGGARAGPEYNVGTGC